MSTIICSKSNQFNSPVAVEDCILINYKKEIKQGSMLPGFGESPTGAGMSTMARLDLMRQWCLRPFQHLSFFLVIFASQCMFQGVQGLYINPILTTLEKRFNWRSFSTGPLSSMSVLGNALVSIFVGHFGKRWHKPRVFGICMLMATLAAVLEALPHFLYGSGSSMAHVGSISIVLNRSRSMTNLQEVCEATNFSSQINQQHNITTDLETPSIRVSGSNTAYAIITFAQLLYGVSYSPLWALGLPFLDDNIRRNRINLAIGVMNALRQVAPVLSHVLAFIMLRIPAHLGETSLTPAHPQWVGAWWLGYIICACVMFTLGNIMLLFPREFTRAKEETVEVEEAAEEMIETAETNEDNTTLNRPLTSKLTEDVKDLPRALWRLASNSVWLTAVMALCFDVIQYGYIIFVFKYTEVQFQQTAFMTSVFGGLLPSLVAVVMNVLSGAGLSLLHRQTLVAYSGLTLLGAVFSALVLYTMTALGCPELPLAGRTGDLIFLEQPCNSNCSCASGLIDPVCGADGEVYFTPCHAGCSSAVDITGQGKMFSSCTCVKEGNALAGLCPSNCSMLIPFVVMLVIQSAVWSLRSVPLINTLLRSCEPRDRGLSMALFVFIAAVFVYPAPIIYGRVIDSTCLISAPGGYADSQGACQLYNRRDLRLRMHGLSIGVQALAMVCYTACFVNAWRLERKQRKELSQNEDQ